MRNLILTACAVVALGATAQEHCCTDSVDMLAYSQLNGEGGMHLAWRDNANAAWTPLGKPSYVNSDFGEWGRLKKMYAPVLERTADGWTLTWIADYDGYVLGTATSDDLIYWRPQTYVVSLADRQGSTQFVVDSTAVTGNVVRVPRCQVKRLAEYAKMRAEQAEKYEEVMAGDSARFAGLQPLAYSLKALPKQAKPISDNLIGIFFEDINYAADGGLYAELIQNRDFEYTQSDRGKNSNWNSLTSWKFPEADKGTRRVMTADPIHPNNPHYLHVEATAPGYAIVNKGFDGIPVKAGQKYDLSMRVRGTAPLTVSLVTPQGKTMAKTQIAVNGQAWAKYDAVLAPNADCPDAVLKITIDKPCQADIDLVSLFPQSTFKGRKNGMRADLAQALADLHPRFVRFPGGCVAHGDGIDNIYDWKGSIGPLEARKPLRNLWGYHQTRGLGYHEYFLLCEDLGAEPLPVLAAGVPCQNSSTPSHHTHDAVTAAGQQGGLPMDEMDAYIQDVLDLIEYANGPADSEWGAKRAEAGHPEPFNLKYIGIGNEDMITDVFVERFKMIYDAVRAAHPEVEVVGTVGPFYEGTDYVEGWKLAHELAIPYVDEHYYVAPAWMIYNQDYYDNYRRNATKVYLGEYAAHLPNRKSTLETALAEALYLTSVERNADVVAMTSYAPLFSKDDHTQWRPDLIYFSNTDVRPSVDYYVQQLYGQNSGDLYIPADAAISTDNEKAAVRVAHSIVRDSRTGDYIVKLANLLPVAVDANVDLSGLKLDKKRTGTVTTLAGDPTDQDLTPATADMAVPANGKLAQQLPPYSFTVVRLPGK